MEKDSELDNGKENLETIFFTIVNDGRPSLKCHSDEVILTLENASNGEEVTKGNVVNHSYTPSLGSTIKRIAPRLDSSPKKQRVRIQQKHGY